MIEIEEKVQCCGCTACSNVCPKKAIDMQQDKEGFMYPSLDKSKCVNCGLCDKVCPIKNKRNNQFEQKGYVLNNKDDDVRAKSTSGGAFSLIAEYVLSKSGIIFGAKFDDDYNVVHDFATNKEEYQKFRGSKYVQSDLKKCFSKVKNFLDEDKLVCFSGTPCQIEGLKCFLRKEYDNLITVDVMCHAAPSPLVWRKYLNYQKSKLKGKKIKEILFRDKSKYGFKYSTMTIKTDKDTYSKGVETDPYLRAFFGDLSDRPSCYECKFKKQNHISDFTIWDCFIAENFDKSLDDDKGTSRMLINSNKGMDIFNIIKENCNYTEVEVSDLVKNVKEMLHSVEKNPRRKMFFEDLNEMKEEKFFAKWFPDTIKVKIERFVRIFMVKTGIYKKIKRLVKKMLRK